MPDKKLTDNEIKKALEYRLKVGGGTRIDKELLDLINRLQAENEKLKIAQFQFISDINSLKVENKRLTTLAELGNTRANDYRVMRDRALKAEAENERLQNCIDEQDIEISRLYKRIDETKAEAYKEFANEFGNLLWQMKTECLQQRDAEYASAFVIAHTKLANLLKEWVGDNNAETEKP